MAGDLNELIEMAYSAAVEDNLWEVWTQGLVDHFGSPGALFWVIDADRFDMCRSSMLFRDADNAMVNAEYLSGPVNDDPQMHRVCEVKKSEIYRDVDHVDLDDKRSVDYLKWQESVVGTRHHVTMSVVLRPGLEAGVSMHRTAVQGPADRNIVGQMRAVFPHLSRAMRLGFQHADALQESWWDGLLVNDDIARILLDRNGSVLRASPAAQSLLSAQDALQICQSRLSCLDPSCDASLAAAIKNACLETGSNATGLIVPCKSGRMPLLVSVYPLVQRRRFLAPFGAAALVCITDRSAPTRRLPSHIYEMLGLTPKETDVANMLLSGHSIASLSCMLDMSPNTARVHLKSLMRKTGTSRQSDLMLFLTALA